MGASGDYAVEDFGGAVVIEVETGWVTSTGSAALAVACPIVGFVRDGLNSADRSGGVGLIGADRDGCGPRSSNIFTYPQLLPVGAGTLVNRQIDWE